jgi:type IV pilus biogenesis protein CpaD/CtpE
MTIGSRCVACAAGVALAGILLCGCDTAPRFNEQFGTSVRANVAAQVLDPAAAANSNPAAGMEGGAAAIAHRRYQDSFREPEKTIPGLVINGVGSK